MPEVTSGCSTVEVETTMESLKADGNDLFAKGCYHDAITRYTEALTLLLSDEHCAAGMREKVEHYLNTLTGDAHPQLSVLLSNRSGAFLSSRRHDEALADADLCVRVKPSWWKGHMRRAYALEAMGKVVHAEGALMASMKCSPPPPNSDEVPKRLRQLRKIIKTMRPESIAADADEVPFQSRKGLRLTNRPLIQSCPLHAEPLDASFYPSAPLWFKRDLYDSFLFELYHPESTFNIMNPREVVPPRDELDSLMTRFMASRIARLRAPRHRALYRGKESTPMTIAQHQQLSKKAGYKVSISERMTKRVAEDPSRKYSWSDLEFLEDDYSHSRSLPALNRKGLEKLASVDFEPECSWCGITLAMPDVPECECGAFFCSEKCRDALEMKGRTRVHAISPPNRIFTCLNQFYWLHASNTAFEWPYDYHHNMSTRWRANKALSDVLSPSFICERDYLIKEEESMIMSHLDGLKRVANLPVDDTTTSLADTILAKHTFNMSCAWIYTRMLAFSSKDSKDRMRFRYNMIETLWALMGDNFALSVPLTPPIDIVEYMARFYERIFVDCDIIEEILD